MSSESERGDRVEAESKVNDSYGTTIPAEVRKALAEEIEPGDTVRWVVSDGQLTMEVVHERYGVFEDAEPFDGPEWDPEEAAESAWSE
jgi:bifunctional DNA-binding transcriptional regulator/antitoxin component of YhaV-PrlF toxin-antitoxin module